MSEHPPQVLVNGPRLSLARRPDGRYLPRRLGARLYRDGDRQGLAPNLARLMPRRRKSDRAQRHPELHQSHIVDRHRPAAGRARIAGNLLRDPATARSDDERRALPCAPIRSMKAFADAGWPRRRRHRRRTKLRAVARQGAEFASGGRSPSPPRRRTGRPAPPNGIDRRRSPSSASPAGDLWPRCRNFAFAPASNCSRPSARTSCTFDDRLCSTQGGGLARRPPTLSTRWSTATSALDAAGRSSC